MSTVTPTDQTPLVISVSDPNDCYCCCCKSACCNCGKGAAACSIGALGSLACTVLGSVSCITVGGGCPTISTIVPPIILGVVAVGLASFPVLSRYGHLSCSESCSPSCSISWSVLTGVLSPIPIVLGTINAFARC